MTSPTISVIIPTYNRPRKLLRAVKSVFNQSYQDFEVIVVNDDPKMDVQDILPNYDKLTYIHHDENYGAPVARNNGILASSGEFIAFLDDDDTWEPKKLENQIEQFEVLGKEYGLVYTGRKTIRDSEIVEKYIPENEGWVHSLLLHKNIIPSESPLIRRSCFSEVGFFDPDLQSCQDWDLWIRISKKYKFAAVPKILATTYEGHDGQISSNPKRKYYGHKRLIEKHRSDLEDSLIALSWQTRRLGLFAIQYGKNIEGLKYLLSAYRYNPRDWPILIYSIMAIVPNPIRDWLFAIRSRAINSIL